MYEIIILLVVFQLKHYVVDFIMQNQYMLRKFQRSGWIVPLSAHCGEHSVATFIICCFFTTPEMALILSLVDFVIHFTMDRIKASPDLLGRYAITDKRYWYSLGLDQMVHHLTHYGIIICLLSDTLMKASTL